ncbi:hypothetical protein SAMN04488047_11557 [Tranquillimonas alkanivorans]|uniref:Uncharacterized protein n=1 Tax=Tranquillimonas alkanivorans TaxID=441119 RepID=A0A1I5TWC4_9RHOB|nr:hypothetical protein SAMN04488047_11557 [Tranquillimonas alkanivorans]
MSDMTLQAPGNSDTWQREHSTTMQADLARGEVSVQLKENRDEGALRTVEVTIRQASDYGRQMRIIGYPEGRPYGAYSALGSACPTASTRNASTGRCSGSSRTGNGNVNSG